MGNVIGTNAAYAMIPGGASCTATGAYAFAAGRRARANHTGSFVWADSADADVASLATNHVRFRAQNGVRFTGGSTYANHIFWNPGDADWTVTSDRNLKENFQPVDTRAVLDQLTGLPMSEWNFIGHTQRHLGPVAQDFRAAFPFAESDTTVNSGDLHGVALAAIQGLNLKLEEKNAALERELAELRSLVMTLAEKVNGSAR